MSEFPLGGVVIAGRKFPVEKVELRDREVQLTFTVPPGKAFGGPITVFDAEGLPCWQGKTINFPDRGTITVFRYGIRLDVVLSAGKTTNVADLPGFRP